MRYSLRTLLIVLALVPPLLAHGYWKAAEYRRHEEFRRIVLAMHNYHGDSVIAQPPVEVRWSTGLSSEK